MRRGVFGRRLLPREVLPVAFGLLVLISLVDFKLLLKVVPLIFVVADVLGLQAAPFLPVVGLGLQQARNYGGVCVPLGVLQHVEVHKSVSPLVDVEHCELRAKVLIESYSLFQTSCVFALRLPRLLPRSANLFPLAGRVHSLIYILYILALFALQPETVAICLHHLGGTSRLRGA